MNGKGKTSTNPTCPVIFSGNLIKLNDNEDFLVQVLICHNMPSVGPPLLRNLLRVLNQGQY